MIVRIRAGLHNRLALLRHLQAPRDYRLLVQIFSVALIAPWLMRLPTAYVARLLTPVRPQPLPDPNRIAQVIHYTDIILRVGRPLVQARCLTRGLTLYYVLRRSGLTVDLHFGAGYVDRVFTAHCWLAQDGVPFAEQIDPRAHYQTMFVIPAVAAAVDLTHASGTATDENTG